MKFASAVVLALVATVSTTSAFAPVHTFRTAAPASLLELEAKKSIEDLSDADLKGKKVLVRCDVNVPLDGKTITDDTRIRSSIPTIEYLKSKGAIVTVCSHLGRPKDGPEDKFSLGPCAERMGELLGQEVTLAPDCIGDEVAKIVNEAKEGDVIMLENTRFYKEEEKNEPGFVEKLAAPFDLYVNDAFGTAHRAHASTEGVTKFLQPSVSGFLLAKELEYLDGAVQNGERPMAAIVGGSKVSSKITVLEALLDKCEKVIIGGGMVFTFLKAKGLGVGDSLVEDDYIQTAKDVMAKAEKLGKEILLPVDIVIADKFDKDANTKVVPVDQIPDGWMGLDNGPETTAQQKEALSDCKTIIMNGPMGVFEFEKFNKGTFGIVDILADLSKEKGAITIIGGGDSVAATEQSGRAGDMSHISTGGGASLELLEGKVLPGVAALNDK
jgi:phosphoglycerate kinase|mmetsp:Transcript_8311/g.15064  ORF Transcript_8311/g.15064 Transcript_8311/m.15064 type:complete len:440 (-) Transcript_8311:104-1423(-)|eukprot:CAMPEP_0202479884 /NCGR_PEP_ID=MMETSP1361-20130828/64_1 /ASSEMBLY_ACC=CAM_ASM_000849 /TAXON_ID=210615 /ORGANISM="Staurosira complex sp., Strain CCMP2646" /LENGTH=439 /DNA_ID=CAMNT_0049107245 /DNA_START=28 /DNA_END=1347 /DNA_ORIENTATION=-